MTVNLFSFIVSLVIVILGARLFLGASIYLARLLRFPEMVIGATFVSLITTMPEALVSVFASATEHTSLALGNIIGSGLVNLGLLFGIVLLGGLPAGQLKEEAGRGKRRSLILFLIILLVYLWFLFFGKIGSYEGIILVAIAFGFLGYTFYYAFRESGDSFVFVETKIETHLKVVFRFLVGAFLLIIGVRFLVESGTILAQTFGLPEIIIGLTLIAVGTSMPELVTTLTALISGHSQISLGNLVGATILTFTLALGLAAVIAQVNVSADLLRFEFPMLLFFGGINVAFAFLPRLPHKSLGVVLVLGYLIYLGLLFRL